MSLGVYLLLWKCGGKVLWRKVWPIEFMKLTKLWEDALHEVWARNPL